MTQPRNLWPLGIITAFVMFIAGTAGLVILACTQKMDLVSGDYYEQEIRYQRQIDSSERARRLAEPATVAYQNARHRITIALPLEHARAKATGQIQLYRPSAAGLDRQLELDLDAHGRQSLETQNLQPGLWRVRVHWAFAEQDYCIDRAVVVEPTPSRFNSSTK